MILGSIIYNFPVILFFFFAFKAKNLWKLMGRTRKKLWNPWDDNGKECERTVKRPGREWKVASINGKELREWNCDGTYESVNGMELTKNFPRSFTNSFRVTSQSLPVPFPVQFWINFQFLLISFYLLLNSSWLYHELHKLF